MKKKSRRSMRPTLRLSALLTILCGVLGARDLTAKADEYSFLHDITHTDSIDLIVMGEHYGAVSLYWKQEVSRRYSDAVVVLAHGGPFILSDGTAVWMGHDQIAGTYLSWGRIVDRVRERFPHRRIVVISCNAFGQHLDRKRVTYATNNVYFYPASMMLDPLTSIFGGGGVDDIMDFVEND